LTTEITEKVKEIKRSFRLQMNGVASTSMREKGVSYGINWGISLPQLRDQAASLGKNYALAIALWKENVRECKILATLLMPAEQMLPEVADIWMEQMPTVEMAEISALNLFQLLPYAAEKAYQWIASDNELRQVCGYHTLARLFARGQEPNERGINEYLDQLQASIEGGTASVRRAAMASLNRFSELGLMYERLAQSLLRRMGY